VGTDRSKYFKRPMVPFLNTVPPEVVFAPVPLTAQQQAHTRTQQAMLDAPPPRTKTIEIQTDYRESEAQTDPFTPDYIINPNQPEPEVLSITNLSYGRGLPASLAEVEAIERQRAKRAFEATLPPLSDAASFETRKRMMEAHEMAEFEHREQAIAEMQEERLELLRVALAQRDERAQQVTEVRIEQLRQRRLQERDRALDEIQKRRIKTLRVLAKRRQQLDPEPHKRDIVGEYANYGSTVYAPVARLGSVPMPEIRHVDVPQLDTLAGLQQLTATLPATLTEAPIRAPNVVSATFGTRKGQQIALDIERLDALIQSQKVTSTTSSSSSSSSAAAAVATAASAAGDHASTVASAAPAAAHHDKAAEPPMAMYKKLEAMVRPQTPTVEESHEDDKEAAIVLLQRLLRGRAQQNLMCDGMEHRRPLIAELRSAEQYPAFAPAEAHRFGADQERLATATVDLLQGMLMSAQFDMISKELHRVNEERALEHTAHVAESTRRTREAQESGRRQADSVRRSISARDFALHTSVVESSATAFLDETIAQALDASAVAHANKASASALSSSLSADASNSTAAAAASLPPPADPAAREEAAAAVVADLVSDFVLPEVEREMERRQQDLVDRRFVDAAHQAVKEAVQQVVEN
jgi:hypothetical protein